MPLLERGDNILITEALVPPELHLMIGVVNTIYGLLLKKYPMVALTFSLNCCVQRDPQFGTGFNGKLCKIVEWN